MKKSILPIYISLITILLISGCDKSDNPNKSDSNTGTSITTGDNNAVSDTGNNSDTDKTTIPAYTPKPTDLIQAQLDSMTIDEKIGQMVIVGLDGLTMDDNALKMITDYKVGGFIFFGRNVENSNQLLSLINAIKAKNTGNKAALFLSIDEEGGRVSRMPPEIMRLPSNRTIGARNDSDFCYKVGNLIAEELELFGLNMNFAPVLDINSNPNNPVIGDRAFGATANIVSNLGIKTMQGLKDRNIVSVVKHFPGHGDTSVDSHVGLPSVDHDITRLRSFELKPFENAINNNTDAIMVAHILIPKIDPKYPATLSKTIISELLRKELSFNGVVITDDMTMGAIIQNYSIGDAIVQSVGAGTDIVLVCHGYQNQVAAIMALREAVQQNVITMERLDQSVYRILKLKQAHKLNDTPANSSNINSSSITALNAKIETLLKELNR